MRYVIYITGPGGVRTLYATFARLSAAIKCANGMRTNKDQWPVVHDARDLKIVHNGRPVIDLSTLSTEDMTRLLNQMAEAQPDLFKEVIK